MKKAITLLASLCFALVISECLNAQLKVHSTGNVGIDATNPLSRFSIGGNGYSDTKAYIYSNNTGTSYKALRIETALPQGSYLYGVFSSIVYGSTGGWPIGMLGSGYRGSTQTSSGRSIGVKGLAGNATNGYNYGVYGTLLGSANGAAIYGVAPGYGDVDVAGLYAGYFRGNVKMENDLNVVGVFINSDINLKKDVQNIESNNIDKLKKLQAIRYKLKTPEELGLVTKTRQDTAKVLFSATELNDPKYKRDYIGLSAQEIQKVYPEAVKVEDNGDLSVNYISLIPVLIEAIKEQQSTIDDLKGQLNKLTTKKEL